MSRSPATPAPVKIAVFGSVADPAETPGRPKTSGPELRSAAATAVLERVLELVAARSPAIAIPMLDSAVVAGTITDAERGELLSEIVGAPSAAGSPLSSGALRVRHAIHAAITRAAPALARPLLDEAVASERLTPAQQARILKRLRRGTPRPVSFLT